MFTISAAQLESLADSIDARVNHQLARCVAAVFPDQAAQIGHGAVDGDAFHDWLHKALELGYRYGIEEPADQAAFLALAVATIEIAPTRPGYLGFSRPVLARESTPGPVKMAWIEQRLSSLAEADAVAARMLGQVRAARAHFQ